MIPVFPQVRSLTVARVIKHLNTVDRVTKVLQGEHDLPEAVVKLHSPKQMTMVRHMVMKVEGDNSVQVGITAAGNIVLQPGDTAEYHDIVVAPGATLECRIKLENWRPELEFPDLKFLITLVVEGPLEVLDG